MPRAGDVPANRRPRRRTGLLFAVKAHRSITHEMRLQRARWRAGRSSSRARLELGEKLGPVLLQFPPSFRAQPELLEEFLSDACRGPAAARALRLAFEFRHASWFAGERGRDVLRRHGAALVLADSSRYPQSAARAAGRVPLSALPRSGGAVRLQLQRSAAGRVGGADPRPGSKRAGTSTPISTTTRGGCAVRNALRLGELAAR